MSSSAILSACSRDASVNRILTPALSMYVRSVRSTDTIAGWLVTGLPNLVFNCCDATGETLPHWDADALTDHRFDSPGCGRDKLLRGRIEQQHAGCVDLKKLTHPVK